MHDGLLHVFGYFIKFPRHRWVLAKLSPQRHHDRLQRVNRAGAFDQGQCLRRFNRCNVLEQDMYTLGGEHGKTLLYLNMLFADIADPDAGWRLRHALQTEPRIVLLGSATSRYHHLFLFNQFGDCEGATLRPGNVHSADGWQELLEPVVKGYQKKGLRLLFRGDAAFAKPELYEYLEQGKIGYAIRLPANQVIQEQIQPLLERPTQWPSREPIVSYHDFAYQAQSWHLPQASGG